LAVRWAVIDEKRWGQLKLHSPAQTSRRIITKGMFTDIGDKHIAHDAVNIVPRVPRVHSFIKIIGHAQANNIIVEVHVYS
jgi:hypothetical protein